MDFNFRDFIILLTLTLIIGCLIYYFRTVNIITDNDMVTVTKYIKVPTINDIISSTISNISPSSLKIILGEASKIVPEDIQVDCLQQSQNLLKTANESKSLKNKKHINTYQNENTLDNFRPIDPETLPYDILPVACSEIKFDESQINYFFPKSFMMLN